MQFKIFRRGILFSASVVSILVLSATAQATLKFYYDPATGNVAFDTAETRNGQLHAFVLNIGPRFTDWQFRYENFIRLSEGTLFEKHARGVGDVSTSPFFKGLYTIGDVMPIGLSETFWTTSFLYGGNDNGPSYSYVDKIGGGQPPNAQFIFGPPVGEFVNRWDLVDPDTLDWATKAKLIYRPSSGEVLIDTLGAGGGYFTGFLLESAGQFRFRDFTPFVETPIKAATASQIGLNADAIEPGRYSLGTILAPGLTRDEFEGVFDLTMFVSRAGFGGGYFDFENEGLQLSLQFVPEPSALALVSLALVGVLGLLRRRS